MNWNCCNCSELAIWMYLPADHKGEEKTRYYCDSCVSRGCSCNINPNDGIEDTDEQGRFYPCCEYIYNDEGFDVC